ncbi:MAG TPA: hypothetical protein GXZ96_04605 [Firmicutes bacterium]|nr:hypothetical protein [Bacillota bacterium]
MTFPWCLLSALLISVLGLPGLWQAKQYREIAVFCFVLVVATVLAIIYVLRLPFPNPLKLMNGVFAPLNDILMRV